MLYVVVVQLAPTLLVTLKTCFSLGAGYAKFGENNWRGRVGDSPYAGTKATYTRGRSTPSKSSLRFDWEAPSNTLLGFTPTRADVSPLESMRSTTKLLQDFNEKNAPQDFMDAETLVSNIEELTTNLNHCSLGCPVAPGETTDSSYFQSNRPEVETAPSVCAHGFKRGKPDSTKATPHVPEEPIDSSSSQSNRPEMETAPLLCDHGFRRGEPDPTVHCRHGIRRMIPKTVSSDVCPHGFRRATVEHGTRKSGHWTFALTA
ncbi:hypothetical protein B0H13DRAFT_2340562 [Mycena leptocephala]|nr:hypothetical protein B0H13DRAFT_2340562 [Mycena leptocephala]